MLHDRSPGGGAASGTVEGYATFEPLDSEVELGGQFGRCNHQLLYSERGVFRMGSGAVTKVGCGSWLFRKETIALLFFVLVLLYKMCGRCEDSQGSWCTETIKIGTLQPLGSWGTCGK